MLKLILLSLAVATCNVRSLALNSEPVSKKSWTDFLDSRSADGSGSYTAVKGGAHCPIQSKCLSLKRITISCDATVVSTGCGACLAGYRRDGETGDICLPVSTSGNFGAVVETEQKIDALAAELRESKSDNLHLAARKDETVAANDSAGAGPVLPPPPVHRPPISRSADYAFYVIIGVTSGLGLLLLVICVVCWYKYNLAAKQAESDFQSADYASRTSGMSGDGKLALSAQMYHYQHQKQQMLAMERSSSSDLHRDASDDDSDLANDEADFTVYECPGLAPTREMEVRNPLFKEEVAPQPDAPFPSAAAAAGSSQGSDASAALK